MQHIIRDALSPEPEYRWDCSEIRLLPPLSTSLVIKSKVVKLSLHPPRHEASKAEGFHASCCDVKVMAFLSALFLTFSLTYINYDFLKDDISP